MADLNDTSKPDNITSHSGDVWDTMLGHTKRAATLVPSSVANKWVGQKWVEYVSGIYTLKSWNGTTYDTIFNSANFLDKTQAQAHTVAAPITTPSLTTSGFTLTTPNYSIAETISTGSILDEKIWRNYCFSNFLVFDVLNDARTFASEYLKIERAGAAITKMTIGASGTRIIKSGVTDDGVSGFQTNSFRAVNQPRLRSHAFNNGFLTATGLTNTPFWSFDNPIYATNLTQTQIAGSPNKSRFTFAEPGTYRFEVGAVVNCSGNASAECEIFFFKNGAFLGRASRAIFAPGTLSNLDSSFEATLLQNDYIEITASMSQSSSTTTTFSYPYAQIWKLS